MIKFIKTLWKRHRCQHVWNRLRTIHGDEINHRNGARSEWECDKCGKWKLSKHLDWHD